MGTLASMGNCQRAMSRAAAIPIVGPIFVSPVKGLVSLAQMVAGLAGAIFFGSLSVCLKNDWYVETGLVAIGHVGMGALGFVYSVSNIATLGLAPIQFEREWNLENRARVIA